MSHYWSDNVHTTAFTPRDYQVELLAAAIEKNVMICLGHNSSKEFIVLKLLQEIAPHLRKSNNKSKKIAIYITYESNGESIYNLIYHLTDLKVCKYVINEENDEEKTDNFEDYVKNDNYQIYIFDICTFEFFLFEKKLNPKDLILIIEDCHEIEQQKCIIDLFRGINPSKIFKILGLAGPLHNAKCDLDALKATLKIFEENLHCKAETASDIVTVLRYCTKPSEYILQCAPPTYDELTICLEEMVTSKVALLNDHRFDPSEIYNEFLDELKAIPDPKLEPKIFLEDYLKILYEMGPWCADRAALMLLSQIEKQKVKTPYERHFLLLCMVSTTLVQIRSYCDYLFHKISNEKERVEKYSSPKVLRLLQVLRYFKPDEYGKENEKLDKISEDIDSLDFQKLQVDLENAFENIENKWESKEVNNILENLENILHKNNLKNMKNETSGTTTPTTSTKITPKIETTLTEDKKQHSVQRSNCDNSIKDSSNESKTLKIRVASNHRHKRKHFTQTNRKHYYQHHHNHNQNESDSLCGIIFCNCKNIAKMLFDLLWEVSRNDPDLSFLSVQYTIDRVADPITESKEAELEHRRQEEVLKRFRMHECNLLIGTSVLEEGIDLPKCNLVIRWDQPTSYRSYVQCKGRARAPQAFHIILVAPKININLNNYKNEFLSDRSHKFLCSNDNNNDLNTEIKTTNNLCTIENHFSNYVTENNEKLEDSEKPEHDKNIEKNKVNVINNKYSSENRDEQNEIKHIKTKNGVMKKTSNENYPKHRLIGELYNNSSKSPSISEIQVIENILHASIDDALNSSNNISVNTNDNHVSNENQNLKEKEQKDDNKETEINDKVEEFKCVVKDLEILNVENSFETSLSAMKEETYKMIEQIAEYREIEKLLLEKCANSEPSEIENIHADVFINCVEPYKPLPDLLTGANVDLGSAISLINKYCAKLPSDTFTKLTPLWRCAKTTRNDVDLYQYTIRLPINSPLKHDILGLPMPTRVLARRMAALIACRELHKYGELDDKLQPIGKEGFKASEADWEDFELEKLDEQIVIENSEPRPGTTKRRQYYYKKIASEFSNCRPAVGIESYLYLINMTLECPIPEEQNTRGRKIYPPEDATQGFGILTLKKIPKVSAFPIFTRSGEVKVSIELSKDKYILTETQIDRINIFVNYTFTNVLRLQKFLMLFDSEATENCVYIVPTIKSPKGIVIDWDFLELIYNNSDKMPKPVSDEIRKNLIFDPEKFKDAVVMPWYRNQDQPQYFYVAEICNHLSPESCFPGENYSTFQQYYYLKYGITIQNSKQPLLDVDHTSARLNFLTPRYVNRKGVALPTSSEETKRAKRENLEQKQILVPELCTIHPFPASLWRAAVCLPCILYRINGLLLADEIRKKVSHDLGLGKMEIKDETFEWPILDFGWSLSEVLKKSKETKITKQNTRRNSGCSHISYDNKNYNDNVNDNETIGNKIKDNTIANMMTIQNLQEEKKKINEGIKIEEQIKIEKTANDLLEEANEKLKNDILIDIGTWSNDMADNINSDKEFDGEEDWGLLPPEVNLCSRNKTNIRYGSPTSWDVGQLSNTNHPIEAYYTDSDASFQSDDDYDMISINSNDDDDYESGRLHIEFKSNNVAEAIETEEEQLKRQKQIAILNDICINEKLYQNTKNIKSGYLFTFKNKQLYEKLKPFMDEYKKSIENTKIDIENSGMLIPYNQKIELNKKKIITPEIFFNDLKSFTELIPYLNKNEIEMYFKHQKKNNDIRLDNNFKLTIDDLIELNRIYLNKMKLKREKYVICGVGDVFDNFVDYQTLDYDTNQQKIVHIDFESINKENKNNEIQSSLNPNPIDHDNEINRKTSMELSPSLPTSSSFVTSLEYNLENFSFDYQPNLIGHPGPSPSIILQALTMSNANDGINLERLETIGDSFLKYAITTYLYCKYEDVHEGKLSHLRSKQVSNLNLYRLGRKKVFGECMIATKFEPHDNWLPPCYYVPKELEKALIEARIPPCHWNLADLPNIKELSSEKICELVKKKAESLGLLDDDELEEIINSPRQTETGNNFPCFIPYNLVTQHSIPDKSVADCVEALIGAYLIECGPRGALLFMAWLGIRVLPINEKVYDSNESQIPGSTQPNPNNDNKIIIYGEWTPPKSPLLKFSPNPYAQLDYLLDGFNEFENNIGYKFKDRSYLLQAMTHASYSPNRLTDCYQRLEFLGDAVLDYLITRHLYEDPRQHSPGALTDLRSALVNNTIFASLAVRHGFHKYFKHLSPGLNEVIDRFVRIQHENGHSISEEYYLLSEEECDDAEDVEVPKALGDVFESVAGAIFLDSNMSLDAVWKVYSNMMRPEIEQFSNSVPKSPIRELLELEPETAKFGKPEKLADGRRVRVTVEVFGKGTFRGIGRNYRIAKCTAAKCALRQLKKQGLISKKH